MIEGFRSPEKTKSVLGIDIGSSAVRLLELSKVADGYRLEACLTEILPVLDTGRPPDHEALCQTITRLVRSSGTSLRSVMASVPDSSVKIKVVELPTGLSESEIEACMEVEIERNFPYSADETVFDYVLLPNNEQQPSAIRVLLVACRLQEVRARQHLFSSAGLDILALDVEGYALQRALLKAHEPVVVLVNIGSSSTTLSVLIGDCMLFHKEHALAGRALTEQIQSYYGLSLQEAELGKCRKNLPNDYSPSVLRPFLELLVDQVRSFRQLFLSAHPFSEINRLILAGGGAALDGLPHLLEESLELPVSIAHPFADMQYAESMKIPSDVAAFSLACGLALRGMDDSGH